MKKILFFVAAVCAAATMQAQKVAPLDSLSTNLQLDSMRVQFASDAVGMVAALQVAQVSIEKDTKMLEGAEKQLKSESTYAKNLEQNLKSSMDCLENLTKSNESDLNTLDQLRKTIDKQYEALRKIELAEPSYENDLVAKLDGYKQQISDAGNRINTSLRTIEEQINEVKKQQSGLEQFKVDVQAKQESLKAMQEIHKANKDAVKNELKAWKKLVAKK